MLLFLGFDKVNHFFLALNVSFFFFYLNREENKTIFIALISHSVELGRIVPARIGRLVYRLSISEVADVFQVVP